MTTPDPEKTEELRGHLDRAQNSSIVDFAYVLELIDEGADVNCFDSKRHWSPLMLSLYEENDIHLKELLKRHADPNNRDNDGREGLHHAAMANVKGTVTLLIAAGADVNKPDDNGWTPLHFAVNHHNLDMVHELLEHGANPTAKTSLGDTPLMLAGDMDFDKAATLLHQHFSMRHSNRVRALRRHSHKKRALKP